MKQPVLDVIEKGLRLRRNVPIYKKGAKVILIYFLPKEAIFFYC